MTAKEQLARLVADALEAGQVTAVTLRACTADEARDMLDRFAPLAPHPVSVYAVEPCQAHGLEWHQGVAFLDLGGQSLTVTISTAHAPKDVQ